jgi:uncharacterized protein YbjT (DUF2867 family)
MDEEKPRLVLIEDTKDRVDAANLADALGAAEVADAPSGGRSPLTWFLLRDEMASRLRSTGGRPGIEGAEPRKVSLPQAEWDLVRELADSISEPGFRPSAGQVAGVLLGQTIRDVVATKPTGTRY